MTSSTSLMTSLGSTAPGLVTLRILRLSPGASGPGNDLSDEEVLVRARNASNGERFRHPEDPGVRTVRLAGRVCASLARVVPGLNDQALFLTTLQRSIASRRGARYSSGVPTLSRNERVLSQSASPSPFILLQAFSRSPGSRERS